MVTFPCSPKWCRGSGQRPGRRRLRPLWAGWGEAMSVVARVRFTRAFGVRVVGVAAHTWGMTGTTWAELTPEWVVPPLNEFAAYGGMAFQLAEITGCVQARGQCAAVCWLLGSRRRAPITEGQGAVTRDAARLESRLALGMAAGRPSEADRYRARLGVPPLRIVEGSAWWAHGVWRVLSWVLGEREDPPIQLSLRAEDGSVIPGTEVYAVPRNPESALWLRSEARREQLELAEAYRWWRDSHPVARDTGRG